jgi:hypothetical protein
LVKEVIVPPPAIGLRKDGRVALQDPTAVEDGFKTDARGIILQMRAKVSKDISASAQTCQGYGLVLFDWDVNAAKNILLQAGLVRARVEAAAQLSKGGGGGG